MGNHRVLVSATIYIWSPPAGIRDLPPIHTPRVAVTERLGPGGAPPIGVLPREWHAYTILHDAYIDDVPNREIMSKLYISEGTFHRQRRKALCAVTTAVWELHQSDAAVMDAADQGSRLVQARGQLAGWKM